MASMLESTPVELAVTAYLLRAYGFRNNVVYELLNDNSFDVSIYDPAIGSTGGTGDKNLNKQLFIPKARDRRGGARGAPAWLPSGERLGDWLSQQIGFTDEDAMENYTVFQVGDSTSVQPLLWVVWSRESLNATSLRLTGIGLVLMPLPLLAAIQDPLLFTK